MHLISTKSTGMVKTGYLGYMKTWNEKYAGIVSLLKLVE